MPNTNKQWFFTFGTIHHDKSGVPLYRKFVVVNAPDSDRARECMYDNYGVQWAFQYPISDLPRQSELYKLREHEELTWTEKSIDGETEDEVETEV